MTLRLESIALEKMSAIPPFPNEEFRDFLVSGTFSLFFRRSLPAAKSDASKGRPLEGSGKEFLCRLAFKLGLSVGGMDGGGGASPGEGGGASPGGGGGGGGGGGADPAPEVGVTVIGGGGGGGGGGGEGAAETGTTGVAGAGLVWLGAAEGSSAVDSLGWWLLNLRWGVGEEGGTGTCCLLFPQDPALVGNLGDGPSLFSFPLTPKT